MHVWKVGDKVFAIGVPDEQVDDSPCGFSIKTEPEVFDFVCAVEGVGRAPYLKTGNWVHVKADADMDAEGRAAYIGHSHAIIAAKLTKETRAELGLT